jgi:thioredoxin reductase (NADPH)
MTQIHETDVAIIGAGPVGLFTVFEAGMIGYNATVIDSLDEIGGQLSALYPEKPIYDIPGFPSILAQDLINNLEKQAAPFKPKYFLGNPISDLVKNDDIITEGGETHHGGFTLKTGDQIIKAKAVCLAAGGGMFAPRKPPVENLEQFEGESVFYSVRGKERFTGQNVVIAGGGDSAVDWAVDLASIANHIHIIHRRNDFRAAEGTVQQMHKLVQEGKITIHAPAQLAKLNGEGKQLSEVIIADLEKNETTLKADALLCFFGIAPSLGPIVNWGLEMDKKTVEVNPETMETNIDGIVAVGDIAHYPAKMHLILCGFSESAIAMKAIQRTINPNKKFRVSFSTSKGIPTE